MTLEEVARAFPNAFHDCYLCAMAIDYEAHRARFVIEVNLGEEYRRVNVIISGLKFVIFDAPDIHQNLSTIQRLEACGRVTEKSFFPQLEEFRENASSETFFYTFWLPQLLANIHVSATEARLDTV